MPYALGNQRWIRHSLISKRAETKLLSHNVLSTVVDNLGEICKNNMMRFLLSWENMRRKRLIENTTDWMA